MKFPVGLRFEKNTHKVVSSSAQKLRDSTIRFLHYDMCADILKPSTITMQNKFKKFIFHNFKHTNSQLQGLS